MNPEHFAAVISLVLNLGELMPELILPVRRRGVLVRILVRPRSAPARMLPAGPLTAFLDTGASDTMLDLGTIHAMGLEPVEQAALNILGRTEVSFHETYEVEIALVLPGEKPRWTPLTVLGGEVYRTGAVAALGRDFLRHFVLTYDGPRERATLCW